MMRSRWHAAILAGLALVMIVGGAPARAADLYGNGAGPSSPYDDDRYAYLYGRDRRAPPEGWTDLRPRPDTWREGRRDDQRWQERCTPREVVRRQLEAQGWYKFGTPRLIDEDRVEAIGRNDNGGVFRVVIDRCSGRIVHMRTITPPPAYDDDYDTYAWRRGPLGRF